MAAVWFLFRLVTTCAFVVAALVLAIGWYVDDPVGPGARLFLAAAVSYVALDLIMATIHAGLLALLARERYLNRRSQI